MGLLGTGSVHYAGRYGRRGSQGPSSGGTPTCQRCLQQGHYTYECQNERLYQSRPSRTQQLVNPKARQRFMDSSEVLPEDAGKKEGIKAEKGLTRTDKKDKKRRRNRSTRSSLSSESGSSSATSSSSSPSDSESDSADSSSYTSGSSSSYTSGSTASTTSSSGSETSKESSSGSSSYSDGSDISSSSGSSSSDEDSRGCQPIRDGGKEGLRKRPRSPSGGSESKERMLPDIARGDGDRKKGRSDPNPLDTAEALKTKVRG